MRPPTRRRCGCIRIVSFEREMPRKLQSGTKAAPNGHSGAFRHSCTYNTVNQCFALDDCKGTSMRVCVDRFNCLVEGRKRSIRNESRCHTESRSKRHFVARLELYGFRGTTIRSVPDRLIFIQNVGKHQARQRRL